MLRCSTGRRDPGIVSESALETFGQHPPRDATPIAEVSKSGVYFRRIREPVPSLFEPLFGQGGKPGWNLSKLRIIRRFPMTFVRIKRFCRLISGFSPRTPADEPHDFRPVRNGAVRSQDRKTQRLATLVRNCSGRVCLAGNGPIRQQKRMNPRPAQIRTGGHP